MLFCQEHKHAENWTLPPLFASIVLQMTDSEEQGLKKKKKKKQPKGLSIL